MGANALIRRRSELFPHVAHEDDAQSQRGHTVRRLLDFGLKRSDVPLEADDLKDFSFQPAEAEGEFRICDEPLDTDVRFIGSRDAGDDESASIWEISSAKAFFDNSLFAKVTLDVRQAHVEAWPERSVTFAADTSRCAGVTCWYREVLSAEGRISRQVGCVQR